MTVGVRISGLTKRYTDTLAIEDVDLDVAPGEFVTLLGPSGCGKTTTLRSIAGLETPDSGEIVIGDQTVFGPGVMVPVHRRRLGMVFQSYAVWPHMTVADNVRFPLKMRGEPKSRQASVVEETLARVGLTDYAGRYPSELSGGQQQRVALARALASEPAVILYDEPLSNLDAALRDQMRFELRTLHRRLGTTAIYVTHDQQEALVLSDRICLMNKGKVIQIGTPSEVYEKPCDRFASDFLGTANLWPVGSVDAAHHRIGLASGHSLEVNTSMLDLPDGRVTIRPHQVEVTDRSVEPAPRSAAGAESGSSRNRFDGVVRDVTYLGDRIRYLVAIADDFMVIAEDNPARSKVQSTGTEVAVTLPPEYCLVVR